ncbi:MAG: hypothetical protein NTV34_06325 [Proteobacteria bacterium]|nr:hypothetical protein [Pseudomonadota bacterium]
MASRTRKVTNVRERKAIKAGAKVKNKIRRVGTTAPNLVLNKPNANELAQIAKRTAAKAVRTKAVTAKPTKVKGAAVKTVKAKAPKAK